MATAHAQLVSFGVTAGVPISTHSQNYGDVAMDTNPPQSGPNDLSSKPWTIGPVLDLNLPLRFSVETGALYSRLNRNTTTGLLAGHGSPTVNFGYSAGVSANAWDVPLLLKYRLAPRRFTPYIGAGATLRHLGGFTGNGLQVDNVLHPQPATFSFATDHNPQIAITALAGVRYQFWHLEVALEIRFHHWDLAGRSTGPERSEITPERDVLKRLPCNKR